MYPSLPSPREMAAWDRAAAELGLPEALLMENAAREALHALRAETGEPTRELAGVSVLLLMGAGNNGGDAACLARHLLDARARPVVVHTRPLARSRGAAGRHVRLARRCGVRFIALPGGDGALAGILEREAPAIIVDGLLGTGFSGNLRPKEEQLVRTVNAWRERAFIVALDIPSGLNGLTGQPQPEAVRAHATVTFEAAKPGLVLPEAAPWVGRLHVRPIGIPRRVRDALPASFRLLTPALAARFPRPSPLWHKGSAGRVLIIGGSVGPQGDLTGAPRLAALGALRAGAGLVTVAAPAGICAAIKAGCPDIMMRPLGPEGTRDWTPDLRDDILRALAGCDTAVIGPGMGRAEATAALTRDVLGAPGSRPPLVIDADALHALARNLPEQDWTDPPDQTAEATGTKTAADGASPGWTLADLVRPADTLTPHPGEAAFLLGLTSAEVQADRFAALAALRSLAPGVWLLKGAGTLIARSSGTSSPRSAATPATSSGGQDSPVIIAPFAEPTLAVGGSGDVLAGCLAALSAQLRHESDASELAASLAVLLHAEAGRLLARRFPARGDTATDIADALPLARAHFLSPSNRRS